VATVETDFAHATGTEKNKPPDAIRAPAVWEKMGWRKGPCYGAPRLLVWLGLAQADHFVAILVLATGLEDFHALKTLQDVAFGGDGALTFETAMLRHKK
jgi:hypothetical protein